LTILTKEKQKAENKKATLSEDRAARKEMPIASGVLDYFPDAIAMIAKVSKLGNDQHNPGQPLHWSRGKSTDHADCIIRHLLDRGVMDTDGVPHTAKVAWRALALLQEELEEAKALELGIPKREVASRGSKYD
jgi:hypothetical protein